MGKLTHAQFARQCAYVAKNAADWAAQILELDGNFDEPAPLETVCKFTDEIRHRLDHLDRKAGRQALKGAEE